ALGITLLNALRSAYPIGYAGLYTLMFESIAENGFRLPESLPFYNVQPIPFAYPPLPFYIAAFLTKIFELTPLTYLRFLPLFLAMGSVVVFYFLLSEICQDHRIAALGGVLFLSMPEIAHYDFSAAGMVRGFALLFLLLFWLCGWKASRTDTPRIRDWLLAAVFLGLTGLSHLSYALFAGFGVITMVLFSPLSWKNKLLLWIRIGLVTGCLMAPWLITVVSRWGFGILFAPLGSHDNFALSQGLYFLVRILTLNPPWILIVFLVGFLNTLLQKRWWWGVWFLITLIGIGESNRFLLLLLIVMTAEFLVFLLAKVDEEVKLKPGQRWIPITTAALLIIALSVPNFVTLFQQQRTSLTDAFLEMGTWLRENTPEESSVLFIQGDHALSEWLPYFSHRVPETGHWGTEWLGTYAEESEQQFLARGIAVNDDYALLQEGIAAYQWSPDYTVLPADSSVTAQFLADHASIVFQNNNYIIVKMP
ncbi:MAG: hypothetical protein V2J07_02585, partial [Anaerolineae bacterium]|nr:hypothetical protein [Anaerolineae bacterium]